MNRSENDYHQKGYYSTILKLFASWLLKSLKRIVI